MVCTYWPPAKRGDSEKLKGQLEQMGFSFTEDETQADLILFNTCAVRENAEYRVYGNVETLKYQEGKTIFDYCSPAGSWSRSMWQKLLELSLRQLGVWHPCDPSPAAAFAYGFGHRQTGSLSGVTRVPTGRLWRGCPFLGIGISVAG